jgi:cytochrome c oxidase assembly protein subunit 17
VEPLVISESFSEFFFYVCDSGATESMSDSPVPPKKTPGCKICCACPQQRRARDECVIFNGMDQCEKEVSAFYQCLLNEGFSQQEVDALRKNTRSM